MSELLTKKAMRNKKILITCAANSDLYDLFPGWSVVEFSKRNSMTAYRENAGNRAEALLISPPLRYIAEEMELRKVGAHLIHKTKGS